MTSSVVSSTALGPLATRFSSKKDKKAESPVPSPNSASDACDWADQEKSATYAILVPTRSPYISLSCYLSVSIYPRGLCEHLLLVPVRPLNEVRELFYRPEPSIGVRLGGDDFTPMIPDSVPYKPRLLQKLDNKGTRERVRSPTSVTGACLRFDVVDHNVHKPEEAIQHRRDPCLPSRS